MTKIDFKREPKKLYRLVGKHHEIYLSDSRRTVPEKPKTTLRRQLSTQHSCVMWFVM
jgi:hypothetical protein